MGDLAQLQAYQAQQMDCGMGGTQRALAAMLQLSPSAASFSAAGSPQFNQSRSPQIPLILPPQNQQYRQQHIGNAGSSLGSFEGSFGQPAAGSFGQPSSGYYPVQATSLAITRPPPSPSQQVAGFEPWNLQSASLHNPLGWAPPRVASKSTVFDTAPGSSHVAQPEAESRDRRIPRPKSGRLDQSRTTEPSLFEEYEQKDLAGKMSAPSCRHRRAKSERANGRPQPPQTNARGLIVPPPSGNGNTNKYNARRRGKADHWSQPTDSSDTAHALPPVARLLESPSNATPQLQTDVDPLSDMAGSLHLTNGEYREPCRDLQLMAPSQDARDRRVPNIRTQLPHHSNRGQHHGAKRYRKDGSGMPPQDPLAIRTNASQSRTGGTLVYSVRQ